MRGPYHNRGLCWRQVDMRLLTIQPKNTNNMPKIFHRSSCDRPKSLLGWTCATKPITDIPIKHHRSSIKSDSPLNIPSGPSCTSFTSTVQKPFSSSVASGSCATWVGRALVLAQPKKQKATPLRHRVTATFREHHGTCQDHHVPSNPILLNGFPCGKKWNFLLGWVRAQFLGIK